MLKPKTGQTFVCYTFHRFIPHNVHLHALKVEHPGLDSTICARLTATDNNRECLMQILLAVMFVSSTKGLVLQHKFRHTLVSKPQNKRRHLFDISFPTTFIRNPARGFPEGYELRQTLFAVIAQSTSEVNSNTRSWRYEEALLILREVD